MRLFLIFILLGCSSLFCYAKDLEEMKYITQIIPPFVIANGAHEVSGEVGLKVINAFQKLKLDPKKIEIIPWSRAVLIAKSSKNVMLFPVAKTFERLKYLDFAIKVYEQKIFFYKLKKNLDIKLKTFDDARNYSICVVRDGNVYDTLKYEKFTKLEEATYYKNNVEKFLKNRCQLIVASEHSILERIKDFNASIDDLERLIEADRIDGNMFVTFSKGTNPEVIKKFKIAFGIR